MRSVRARSHTKGVERRQQGHGLDATGDARVAVQVRRRPPALHRHGHELVGVDELGDRGLRVSLVEAPVVGEVADRRDAERPPRLAHELAQRIILADRRVEHVGGQPSLGEVVVPLEVLAARDDDPTVEEHGLEGGLDLRPAPPRPRAPVGLVLDLRRRQRPLGGELAEHEVGHAAVGAIPALGLARARELVLAVPLPQGPGLERDERGLVRPRLDVGRPAREREPVELRLVVGAEAREEREVVAALEDVDRVDLQHREPLQREVELARADGPGRPPEALRREGDAPRLGCREVHVHDPSEPLRQQVFSRRSPGRRRGGPGVP